MLNRISPRDFSIDTEIIAPKIYWDFQREISSKWVLVNDEVRWELEDFLQEYARFLWLTNRKIFFRIDAYFDENKLYILDMNASFVDGWWNAINFTRAVSWGVWEILSWYFPASFFLQEDVYRPEFELAIREIWQQTWECIWETKTLDFSKQTYVYWALKDSETQENFYPFNWIKNDDKRNLARFSRIWRWDLVRIPYIFSPEETKYSELPENVALKVASKNDIKSDWRNKVFIWKPKKWQSLWEEWKLVAQTLQNPQKNDNWENMQAIILTAWAKVIAWYVQNSARNIINDSSVQSPLIFK